MYLSVGQIERENHYLKVANKSFKMRKILNSLKELTNKNCVHEEIAIILILGIVEKLFLMPFANTW
jgi:hypothetical protein